MAEAPVDNTTLPTKILYGAANVGKGIFLAATDAPQPILNFYNHTVGWFLGAVTENTNHIQMLEHKKGHMYTDPRWNKAISALENSMEEYRALDKRSWCGIVIPDPRNLPYHLFLGESGPYKENLFEYQIDSIPDIVKAYYARDLIRKQDTNIDTLIYQKNRPQKQNNLERNPNIFTFSENHSRSMQKQVTDAEELLQERMMQTKFQIGPKSNMENCQVMADSIAMGNGFRPKMLKTEDFGWHANGFDRPAHNGTYRCDNLIFESQEQQDKFMGRFQVWKDTLLNKDILPKDE
jgi:hypothetical protein